MSPLAYGPVDRAALPGHRIPRFRGARLPKLKRKMERAAAEFAAVWNRHRLPPLSEATREQLELVMQCIDPKGSHPKDPFPWPVVRAGRAYLKARAAYVAAATKR